MSEGILGLIAVAKILQGCNDPEEEEEGSYGTRKLMGRKPGKFR